MSLNERLEFLINVNAEGAIKGFKTVGEEAEHNLTKAQSGIEKTGQKMTKVGSGMVVGAGLIGVGLLELSKKWEETALSAGKLATQTGLTVEQASRWSVVAKGADVDTSVLASSLGKMDKAIEATPEKFDELGASIVRTKDGQIDASATFLSTVDALNAHGGAANNAATATALLGKGWQGMAEILKQSSGDLKASLAAVSDQQVFNEDDVSQAEQFRDTMKELGNNAQGLALTLGKSAAPVVADVTSALSGMVKGLTAADSATGGLIGKIAAIGALGVGAAGTLSVIGGQAIKMRDKLVPVGKDGSRALSGLGYAAVGVGVGIAAFGVITEIMGARAKQAKENVDDLSKRMEHLGLTADEAARQKIAEFIAKNDDLARVMKVAGLTTKDLQTAVTGGADAVAVFNKELSASHPALEGHVALTGRAGAAQSVTTLDMAHLTGEISRQGAAFDTVTASMSTTEDATKTLGETQEETDKKSAASQKAYTDGALAANKEMVTSEEGVVKAHQDELKAQQDVTNAARAAIDAKWAYTEAQQATKEAIEQATATLADSESTENDKTDAVFAGVDAALAQAGAYVTMKGDQDDAKAANQDMIKSLYGTATTLAPDSPIRQGILNYIADLQGIPKDVSTTVTTAYVDTGAVGTHHDSYTPGGTVVKSNTYNPQGSGQWSGTDSAPAGVQDVAENGMELVIGRQARNFRGGEQVLNNRQTKAALAGGHGPTIHQHFYGITGDSEVAKRSAREIGWQLRSGL